MWQITHCPYCRYFDFKKSCCGLVFLSFSDDFNRGDGCKYFKKGYRYMFRRIKSVLIIFILFLFFVGVAFSEVLPIEQLKSDCYNKSDYVRSGMACYTLAGVYRTGAYGITPDLAKAVKYLRMSCNSGYGQGCVDLAVFYYKGEFVKKDIKTFVGLYKRACNGVAIPDGRACYYLGNMYQAGKFVQQDEKKAKEYFKRACKLKVTKACSKY